MPILLLFSDTLMPRIKCNVRLRVRCVNRWLFLKSRSSELWRRVVRTATWISIAMTISDVASVLVSLLQRSGFVWMRSRQGKLTSVRACVCVCRFLSFCRFSFLCISALFTNNTCVCRSRCCLHGPLKRRYPTTTLHGVTAQQTSSECVCLQVPYFQVLTFPLRGTERYFTHTSF
jgi:hypothetical protein